MNRIMWIYCSVSLYLIFSLLSMAGTGYSLETPTPEIYSEQMDISMQKGDYRQAVVSGIEAERLFKRSGDINKQIIILTKLSTAYQSLGQYKKAIESLTSSLDLAKKTGEPFQIGSVLSKLGNAYIFTEQFDKAEIYLNEAIDLSIQENIFAVKASTLNYLGNLRALRKMYGEAIVAYKESVILSEKTDNQLLAAYVLANTAKVLMQSGNYDDAEGILGSAYEKHIRLGNSHDKAYGLINIGQLYRQLASTLPSRSLLMKSTASRVLKEAASIAEDINDHLAASYAFGYLGQIYEDGGLHSDALTFTRRAVFEAQEVNAPESLYLWQWQSGRLLKSEGRIDEAIKAYRSAVFYLQSIRQELLGDCKVYNQLSFRESVEPVYVGLVDLLLKRTDSITEQKATEPYLLEARQTIELLKTAELQDYFQNACVAKQIKAKQTDNISMHTAVVYIIPLPERLELLLELPSGIKKTTVQVNKDTLTEEIRLFRQMLEKRTTREYMVEAHRLYDWLIRPLETDLYTQKIDTLIFIPDGPLRTIPMAALHDGKEFLIKKFAIATTAGISLTYPHPIQRDKIEVLLTGLSEPVQGFPPLVNVQSELKAIKEIFQSKLLENHDFLIPAMKKELKYRPYTIVHIASHGEFSNDVNKTFLLTWDEKLTMDHLEKFMGVSKFRKEPVELLTLSACQTASGDDRAALGLAGIAIKAGARSAIATLWYINDQASAELITEFYRQFRDKSLSKARALQQAQLKLLSDERYQHPSYWSPFLLIGNWL